MKKVTIIIIITLLLSGGIGYWVYRQGYISKNIWGKKDDKYEYKDQELKKISEEAGINLEKAMVNLDEEKIYTNQSIDKIRNKDNIIYEGKIIKNKDNNKEWTLRVIIPNEKEKKYAIWKEGEIKTSPTLIGELKEIGYEEWEYKSDNKEELKGIFIIGNIGENNTIQKVQYMIEK